MLRKRKFIIKAILFFILTILHGLNQTRAEHTNPRLSLEEAIKLSVRKNPNVQMSQLSQVLQKFAVEVQQWEFQPHYSFTAAHKTLRTYSITSTGRVTSNESGFEPSVSLLTPVGTRMKLASVNNMSDHYNPGLSLQIIQPLLRGFGKAVVEADLYNALDSEKISRLNVREELQNTITQVINSYLDVIAAQNTLAIDQQALERGATALDQTKKFIRAGHKAGVELVAVQASMANLLTRIENDKNNLEQARYALLTNIGLDPDTNIIFESVNIPKLIKKYRVPTLEESKRLIIENDVSYQVAEITLEGSSKRELMRAKDNARWQLDLTLEGNVGNGIGGGRSAGINSLVNGVNQSNSASINLTIPIDDRVAKNAIASAAIAIEQSRIGLRKQKWQIETTVINGWKNIYSAERMLHFAENAANLQQQTYQINAKKYTFGLIDGLELNTAQQELISAEKDLSDNRINYLKALVNLDNLTGMTLKTWDIKVHYC